MFRNVLARATNSARVFFYWASIVRLRPSWFDPCFRSPMFTERTPEWDFPSSASQLFSIIQKLLVERIMSQSHLELKKEIIRNIRRCKNREKPFRSARNVRSIIRSSRGGSRPNRNLRSSAIPIMDLVSNREIIDLTG